MPDEPHLHVARVVAEGASPGRWLFVLPGIYGAGRNWASVARRFVDGQPAWGAALVDLRQHGDSRGFAPPHTIAAAAADVARAAHAEGLEPTLVLGHSFGGKVALVAARAGLSGLRQVWLVDSTPGVREPAGSAWDMLGVLRRNAGPFAARDDAVGALVGEGLALPLARWMATNLEEDAGAYRWRIDPDDMEELLRSFFATDAWDVVDAPPDGVAVHVLKASDSSLLDEAACARVEAASERHGRTTLHRVSGGHWLNADNPDALIELLIDHLG